MLYAGDFRAAPRAARWSDVSAQALRHRFPSFIFSRHAYACLRAAAAMFSLRMHDFIFASLLRYAAFQQARMHGRQRK
jgi:hypothetical protein